MKNLHITICLSLLIFSCQNNPSENTTDDQITIPKDETVDSTTVENIIQEDTISPDTFYFGNKQLFIAPVKDTACFIDKVPSNQKKEHLIATDPTIQRIGDTLVFTLNNQDTVLLVNTARETDKWTDFGYNYYFKNDHADIDYWEVFAMGYEVHTTVLINKNSGDMTRCPGGVSVSPDQNYVAVFNADQEANYTTNHISLFQPVSDSLKKLCFIDLDLKKWAPYAIRWISPTTFLIKQGRFSEKGYHIEYNCAKGEIKEK